MSCYCILFHHKALIQPLQWWEDPLHIRRKQVIVSASINSFTLCPRFLCWLPQPQRRVALSFVFCFLGFFLGGVDFFHFLKFLLFESVNLSFNMLMGFSHHGDSCHFSLTQTKAETEKKSFFAMRKTLGPEANSKLTMTFPHNLCQAFRSCH